MKNIFYAIIPICTLSSCGVLTDANSELNNGYYFQRQDGDRKQVYVDITEEQVDIYQVERRAGERSIDSLAGYQRYPKESFGRTEDITALWEHSLDLDFLTILLKYRPARSGVPAQLNSDLNGAGYLGYRVDRYKLAYETDALGHSSLESSRVGFSFGVFTGIGNTAMTPTTTNEQIEQEYDGIVWLNGIAAIAGINNFTVGLSLGFDSLLDSNRDYWIYQNKPWLGLALGLNLN